MNAPQDPERIIALIRERERVPILKYYKSLNARLLSFNKWPIALEQKPKDLAENGFYYSSVGDEVTVVFFPK